MFQPIKIAPSILSADFMHLESSVDLVTDAGANFIHIDVMDGHFVPNLTIGVPHVKALHAWGRLPLDVHLMVSNPLEELPWFIQAGADILTVHAESLQGQWLNRAVTLIHEGGAQACVAVKPHTLLTSLAPVIAELDMVLIMSVEPGFSGQSYIEGSEERVAEVVSMAREAGNEKLLIEVDGGIDRNTVARVCGAGADVVVCGNAIYGANDPVFALQEIKEIGDRARLEALGDLG